MPYPAEKIQASHLPGLTFRIVEVHDLTALQEISAQTFLESYAWGNSAESMQLYIDKNFSQERLSVEMLDPGSTFWFVCSVDKPVAYLKVNTGNSQTELRNNDCLEIERIYVLQSFQGKGIGKFLCQKAFEMARQRKLTFVWLGVWAENSKAIQFYSRLGFEAFDRHIFILGEEEQSDIMMKIAV